MDPPSPRRLLEQPRSGVETTPKGCRHATHAAAARRPHSSSASASPCGVRPRRRRSSVGRMLRPVASWIRPAGVSLVRVSAAAPGSRPWYVIERWRAERGVESLFGGSKRAGCDDSLVKRAVGEPSRSCHGEGHVRQSWLPIGCGGSLRGRGSCTCAGSDRGTGEARLASLVSKDRLYRPMAKSSGGQRESEGVVVVMIGVQNNAPGAKGPCFDRACNEGMR